MQGLEEVRMCHMTVTADHSDLYEGRKTATCFSFKDHKETVVGQSCLRTLCFIMNDFELRVSERLNKLDSSRLHLGQKVQL